MVKRGPFQGAMALALGLLAFGQTAEAADCQQDDTIAYPNGPDCPWVKISVPDASGNPTSAYDYPSGAATTWFNVNGDPVIRQDPNYPNVHWVAYTYGHASGSPLPIEPHTEIHLAKLKANGDLVLADSTKSVSGGVPGGVLFPNVTGIQNVANPNKTGHMGSEVINFVWANGGLYSARVRYWIENNMGFSGRAAHSFRIDVTRSAAGTFPGLQSASGDDKHFLIGSWGATYGNAWAQLEVAGATAQRLDLLNTEANDCAMWNEPALYYDASINANKLWLFLRCHRWIGSTERVDLSDMFVFSLDIHTPFNGTTGNPKFKDRSWVFETKLKGVSAALDNSQKIARKLLGTGAGSADVSLTEIDVTKSTISNKLLALLTVDFNAGGGGSTVYSHSGCYAVELEWSGGKPRLKEVGIVNKKPNVLAEVQASLLMPYVAGVGPFDDALDPPLAYNDDPLGPSSCGYASTVPASDPSISGIVIGYRYNDNGEAQPGTGDDNPDGPPINYPDQSFMRWELHDSGVRP